MRNVLISLLVHPADLLHPSPDPHSKASRLLLSSVNVHVSACHKATVQTEQ